MILICISLLQILKTNNMWGCHLPVTVIAGVGSGGASRTALVLVLATVDAGRERVLSEVVAVRWRVGGRDLAAVLLVRARRVLRR